VTARLLAAALVALVVARGGCADAAAPAASALWATLAALVAAALFARGAVPAPRRLPALWLGAAWAGWSLLSIGWSIDRGATLAGSSQLAAAVCCGLAIAATISGQRRVFAWSAVLGALVAAAAALRQLLFGFSALRDELTAGSLAADTWTREVVAAGRVFGTMLAPDLLAGFLAPALLLAVALAISERGLLRWSALLAAAVIAAAFVATRSVGGAIALVLGAALWLLFSRAGSAPMDRLRPWLTAAVAIGVAIAAGWSRVAGLTHRFNERLVNQVTALRAALESPLLGHGQDTFGALAPGLRENSEPLTRYAHGLLGQAASDGGAIGFALALLLVVAAVWQAVRVLRADNTSALQHGAAAAVLAALAHGLLDYDLQFAEHQLMLWVCLALAAPDRAAPEPSVPATRLRWPARAALVAVALALALVCGWRAAAVTATRTTGESDLCADIEARDAATRWAPPNARLYRELARSWLTCEARPERLERALEWSGAAQAASPVDAILRAEHAYVLAVAGKNDQAVAEAAAAVAAWPRVGRVQAYRGLVVARSGDVVTAAECYRRGQQLDPLDVVVKALADLLQQIAPETLTAREAPATAP